MKIITIQPVKEEDLSIILEYDGQHVYISSDVSPIVCSQEQADRLGELLRSPHKIPDKDQ